MAGASVNPVAHGGAEGFTDQPRPLLTKADVGNGQTDNGEIGPLVEAPVKQRVAHGEAGGLWALGSRFAQRRINVVAHGLGNSPEYQADAHAGREDHAKPGGKGEFRIFAIGTQPDLAVVAGGKTHAKHQESGGGKQVQPAEVSGCEIQGVIGAAGEMGGPANTENDKGEQKNQRQRENPPGASGHGVRFRA